MVVPFYLEGLRLAPVTGIQGYPSTWPTFLRYLSVANIPEGGKYGNSGLLLNRSGCLLPTKKGVFLLSRADASKIC